MKYTLITILSLLFMLKSFSQSTDDCVKLYITHEKIHVDFFKKNPFNGKHVILKKRNALNLIVMWDANLLLNGSVYKFDELRPFVKEFILNTKCEACRPERPDSAKILVTYDLNANYEFFEKVFNELINSYHEIWDEKAVLMFGENYSSLNRYKKKKIRNLVPIHLIDESHADVEILPTMVDCF